MGWPVYSPNCFQKPNRTWWCKVSTPTLVPLQAQTFLCNNFWWKIATGQSLKVMAVFYIVWLDVMPSMGTKEKISQFLLKQANQNNPKIKVEGTQHHSTHKPASWFLKLWVWQLVAFVCSLQRSILSFWVFMHCREGSLNLSHPLMDPAQAYFSIHLDLEGLVWTSPSESPKIISPEEGRKPFKVRM